MARERDREDATVEFEDVLCKHETDLAILCAIDGEDLWIPKSQVRDDSEVFDAGEHNRGTLVITAWFAELKGLL